MLRARNPRVLPTRRCHRPDPPDRHRHMCELPWWHDAAHWQDGSLSLLHLLDLRPAGQDRVQGPLDPHGQARPTGDRAARRSCAEGDGIARRHVEEIDRRIARSSPWVASCSGRRMYAGMAEFASAG